MNTADSNKEKFFLLCASLTVYFPEYEINIDKEMGNVKFAHKTEPSKGFYLRPDLYRGKFEISPYIVKKPDYRFYDVYNDNGEKIVSPSCGFSIDRVAEQIAHGINVRFMPYFEIYYAAWMKQWQHDHDYKTNKDATIKEVASLIGVECELARNTMNEASREILHTYHSENKGLNKIISSIRVSSADSIKIETNYLNMEQARRLIEFIKTL